MTLVEAIVQRLLSISAVTAIVVDRIYPVIAAEDTMPCITVRRSKLVPEDTLEGQADTEMRTVVVTSWASSYAAADALARIVAGSRPQLEQAATGLNGWTSGDDPMIESCLLADESDEAEDLGDGSGGIAFGVSQEYEIQVSQEES